MSFLCTTIQVVEHLLRVNPLYHKIGGTFSKVGQWAIVPSMTLEQQLRKCGLYVANLLREWRR